MYCVDAITPMLADWTCKIQVVDKFRSRESKDHTVHFQPIIVQDENVLSLQRLLDNKCTEHLHIRNIKHLLYFARLLEQQVSIVLYCDDIDRYHHLFTFFETYLLSSAKVREARADSIQVHNFERVVNRVYN